MNIIQDWRSVLKKAWSARLMILAALMSGAEIVIPFLSSSMPRGIFAILSFVSVSGAFIARFVAQKELSDGPTK